MFRYFFIDFRVLGDTSGMLELTVDQSIRTIVAGIVLHNRAVLARVQPPPYQRERIPPVADAVYADNTDGLLMRDRLINTYFN